LAGSETGKIERTELAEIAVARGVRLIEPSIGTSLISIVERHDRAGL
jgi:hypothetical protein